MKMCNVSCTTRGKWEKNEMLRENVEAQKWDTHTPKNRLIILNDLGFPTKGGKRSMNCEQPHDEPEAYLTEAVWLKPWH